MTPEEKTTLLSVVKIVNDFFSQYTCASYVETNLNQVRLHISADLEIRFGISEDRIYIWNSRLDTRDYIPLADTKEELRKELRKLASHLVWYLLKQKKQEQQELAGIDWSLLVDDKRGNRWDGCSFDFTTPDGTSFRATRYNSKLTIACAEDGMIPLLSALTGKKINSNAILPKTESLSTDGLMAKIDKWLNET